MGEHNQDQDDVAEPARPPLTAARAREVTAGLRKAMDDVRRSVAVQPSWSGAVVLCDACSDDPRCSCCDVYWVSQQDWTDLELMAHL
ncbi:MULTISPECIES: hypothetical protein [unclassified Streptomyces]|uniref:hypothetical protein n=1 Tax=unclassified Streptomyces TaxID=2593676 RepID=UPI0033CADC0F